jgi:hypothetical protein
MCKANGSVGFSFVSGLNGLKDVCGLHDQLLKHGNLDASPVQGEQSV